MIFVILIVIFFVLLFFVFRAPPPELLRLLGFLALLIVGIILVYEFVVLVFHFNPDPYRLRLARMLTDNKIIDLTQFVPGLAEDLDMIQRVDTDMEQEDPQEEWLVFYRYDAANANTESPVGPFGAAIYDANRCRPPALQSYELVPLSYDYLGQDWAAAKVENIIPYADPLSGNVDRPEVIVNGQTRGVVTDLNIFRKVGVDPDCFQIRSWQQAHPGQIFPYAEWLRYGTIGSFRGNYLVRRNKSTVEVYDRAGFERSQIVIRRQYKPNDANGTYFTGSVPAALVPPAEYGLEFGPGWPDNIPQVYYPEKEVLAFYLSLTRDGNNLERAKSYLSEPAKTHYDINTDTFGLYAGADGIARARDKLGRVLVWEIRYVPSVDAERLHETRQVTAVLVGVNDDGRVDTAHPCQVTWEVIGWPNPSALPYGCEWRLDSYQSTCPSPGEHGEWDDDRQVLGLAAR